MRRIDLKPGETQVSLGLTDPQMQRTACFDARDGIAYIEVSVPGEVSAVLVVDWEVPGSSASLTWLTQSLVINEVNRAHVWSGPVPGGIKLTLKFDNLGVTVTARVRIDLCAKRRGFNFTRGMWHRDLSDTIRYRPALRPFNPFPEGKDRPRAKRRGRRKCAPPIAVASGPGAAESASVRLPTSFVLRKLFGGTSPPASGGGGGGSAASAKEACPAVGVCEPDPRALDWVVADGAPGAWTVAGSGSCDPQTVVPDPEAFQAYGKFGASFVLTVPGTAIQFEFPPRAAMGVTLPAAWYRYVARCEDFGALWEDVTGGLENQRLPKAALLDILCSTGNSEGSNGFDLDPLISGDGEDWDWVTTATWDSDQLAWYLTQLLGLLHATFDRVPASVRSRRLGGTTALTRRSQCAFRVGGDEPTKWRLLVVDTTKFIGAAGPFNFQTGTWGPTLNWPEASSDFNFRAQTGTVEWDFNYLIHLQAARIAHRMPAAAQFYALARLLTMVAAKYREQLSASTITYRSSVVFSNAFDGLVQAARLYHQHYLACLMQPGKIVVHELFHTHNAWAFYDFHENELVWSNETDHCRSGCAQEKMSSAWLARLSSDFREDGFGFPWFKEAADGFPIAMEYGAEPSNESTCVSGDEPIAGVESSPGESGSVSLAWEMSEWGSTAPSVGWRASFDQPQSLGVDIARLIAERTAAWLDIDLTVAAHERDIATLTRQRSEDRTLYALSLGPVWLAYHQWQVSELGNARERVRKDFANRIKALEERLQNSFAWTCWDPDQGGVTCGESGRCG